ncbi:hypothetical protein CKO28_20550 [Rhodovibrio sodomensis]|uniref:Uncharacterized protein n=1 Tax=Rhodovibrio sodomensis TaxID=1088 RepID=A0ABS1DL05_9PROT|nr:hypothetical protein [Rhodovibrio sodomensis]MBK1670418.1 hypothetical protein [Rhodovibrio sodomensis]
MAQCLPIGSELPADHDSLATFDLHLDSQDIEAALTHVPRHRISSLGGVTGVLVDILDPDTLEVWATGSSRPFDRASNYTRVL